MKKSIWLIAIATLAIGGGATTLIARPDMYQSKEETLTQSLVNKSYASPPSDDGSEESEVTSSMELIDLVTVRNPFSSDNTVMTRIVVPDDDTLTSASSVSEFTIPGTILELDNDFTHLGLDVLKLNHIKTFIIAHEYKFENDALIVFTGKTLMGNNHAWKSLPEQIEVKQGSKVVVTYTTTNGGEHWLGDVHVKKI